MNRFRRFIDKAHSLFLKDEYFNWEKMNEELIESRELFSGLFNNSTMGLYQTTPDGKILSANPAIIKMLKFDSLEDLLSRDLSQGSYVDENRREEFKRILDEKGEITNFESEWYTKDREIIYVREGARAIRNKEGQIIRYDGAVENVTYKKKAEIELLKAKEKAEESDRLKTAFLQNMSHEIRTPMNAIMGFSDLINDPELSPEKRKVFTSVIRNSSKQLLSIVTDILTISSLETKQEKLNISKFCINSLILELLSIFKQSALNQNLSLYSKQHLSDNQSEIYADRTKVTQVLTNLITNAIKFTHEGYVEFGYYLKDNVLEFFTKDTGIGIQKDFQENIFNRFRQANNSINKKYGGTGLGLSISKGYIELMGGKIWVESEENKGSTFYFTIPYNPVQNNNENDIKEQRINNTPTILIAEDEEYNFLLIEQLLLNLNVNLIHTRNGEETVKVCKENENIDLILMDIKMPFMDGQTAAKLIKEFRPELPIIAQSAYALDHEIKALKNEFDHYITKPIEKSILIKSLSEYLNLTHPVKITNL